MSDKKTHIQRFNELKREQIRLAKQARYYEKQRQELKKKIEKNAD